MNEIEWNWMSINEHWENKPKYFGCQFQPSETHTVYWRINIWKPTVVFINNTNKRRDKNVNHHQINQCFNVIYQWQKCTHTHKATTNKLQRSAANRKGDENVEKEERTCTKNTKHIRLATNPLHIRIMKWIVSTKQNKIKNMNEKKKNNNGIKVHQTATASIAGG